MKIIELPLKTNTYQTKASLTAYLQTPVPNTQVQTFKPLIFAPGGSMTHLPVEQSEKTALAFLAKGYQVFVLRYSYTTDQQPVYPKPLLDLAYAVNLVKTHATEWFLNADKLTIMGFSAGGHVAAVYNNFWSAPWLSETTGIVPNNLKPAAVILGYPVIDLTLGFPKDQTTINQWSTDEKFQIVSTHVNQNNAPTFLWTTLNDPLVDVQNTINYSQSLLNHQIPQELHIFAHGPHGMAIANEFVAHHPDGNQPHVAHWVNLVNEWLTDLLK